MSNQFAFSVLDKAISTKRPHGAASTNYFVDYLEDIVGGKRDSCGNLHVKIGESKSLLVAHIDTVHTTDGPNKFSKSSESWSARGSPLGADDGAGVAVLCHMIHNNIPGFYIFTQGEELGGIGAKHLFNNNKTLLKKFSRAIAFDRRGTYSVITHQRVGRCCSDEFAEALAEQLCSTGLLYASDDTGSYTDTAEFISLIPECTNISVGYMHEHTNSETLNIVHFTKLLNAILTIDWENLPVVRDVKSHEGRVVYGYRF